jgi:hypothetical protein
MENIDSEEIVRRMWGFGLDAWNNALVTFLVLAAMATFVTIRLAKQEASDAKKQLNAYKLTVAGQIATAETKGLEAGTMAGNALVRAAELEKEAAELRRQNLEMERAFSPRVLSFSGTDITELQKFGGVRWIIRSVDRDEPHDFGGQLLFLLNSTPGWVQIQDAPTPEFAGAIPGKVTVWHHPAVEAAADALLEILSRSSIEASRIRMPQNVVDAIGPNSLLIAVAAKQPLQVQRFMKATMEQMEKERAEWMAQHRAQ